MKTKRDRKQENKKETVCEKNDMSIPVTILSKS